MFMYDKVYSIEYDESNEYDDYFYKEDKYFLSYESARKFLLEHFDERITHNKTTYFVLKPHREYCSKYGYGCIATIEELELYKDDIKEDN